MFAIQAVFKPKGGRKDGKSRSVPGKPRPLIKIRELILESYRNSAFHKNLSSHLQEIPPGSSLGSYSHRIRESTAFIEDAWQALERAGRMLDRQRKNVWWTTWYFDLRMKLIELQAWTAVVEVPESIPYLGLEAVPLGYPTLADELLDASRRMVRFDVFRFAHTAESYARSLLAFSIWRERLQAKGRFFTSNGGNSTAEKAEAERLKMIAEAHLTRQVEMAEMLAGRSRPGNESALATIKQILRERNSYDRPWPTSKLDPQIRVYVDHVVKKISDIHRFCSGSR